LNEIRISNEYSRNNAILDVSNLDLSKPYVMTLKPYKRDRSTEQNALSHVWYAQVASTLREDTAEGVKSYCKLHFGIPILRGADAEFREAYNRTLINLSYEQKLEIMAWFPVTSLMKTDQTSMYLEQIQHHYAGQGVQLCFPNEPI